MKGRENHETPSAAKPQPKEVETETTTDHKNSISCTAPPFPVKQLDERSEAYRTRVAHRASAACHD